MNRVSSDEERRSAAIEAVAGRVRERWPAREADQVAHFTALYYQGVAPEDIAYSEIGNLYGAALSHWSLGHERPRGEPAIHVYNPTPEQNGWECTHTIVQLVTDDMPFLVDSVSMALNRLGLTVHLIIHPVLAVQRDGAGRVTEVEGGPRDRGRHENAEAWMHFEVDRQTGDERLAEIRGTVADTLEDVRLAVTDWKAMCGQLDNAIRALRRHAPPIDETDRAEVLEFLRWIREDHFTFLGYRRYDLQRQDGKDRLDAVGDSSLGVLRRSAGDHRSASFELLPPEVRALARDSDPLILTKSNTRATVHRPGYMDYLGIKRFNTRGEVIGEHRFLGLFTSAAYNRNPRTIPLLRRKLDFVLQRANLPPASHAGKALTNILETHPRDELFQATPGELYETVKGILHLQERQRVRLFVRYDTYRRFVSCLVYAPRERYNTDVRQRMQAILTEAFGGAHTEFSVQLSESVLARIHFIVRLAEPGRPDYDQTELERRIANTMRSWPDDLADALLDYYGEERGNALFSRYARAFDAAYREDASARSAARDIERLETLDAGEDLAISLYRPLEAEAGVLRFKLFQAGAPITLSDVLPVLENMGVDVADERPYDVTRDDGRHFWIHDFGLIYRRAGQLEAERIRDAFQRTFAAVWRRQADDDGFNRLTLAAGLEWRDIAMLRAISRYLRQAGTAYSQEYVEETLAANAPITNELVRLFNARLDPERADDSTAARLSESINTRLDAVASLDEDRILRRFRAAIEATRRTNYFRTDDAGREREHIALKFEPAGIPDMPKPVPAYEIFVYSPRMEGVHLRGGRVARGGLRWSDRREDYRTEILGLMKAQMVKNAVIVPVGAKGGFICKQLPDERQAMAAEVLDCYRTLIRGLLDVTDNIVDGAVVPPAQVRRLDDDDPYLVVAADKGTATFSDHANAVAGEYGFWLRDAFASGGSAGYDHKKMGITARGAWEAVRRHFREMGRDIQREPFTCVGVGDMSGDVFGNGMLLSEHTRLIAAFDHRHIFIDPDPDTARAFAERQRLFAAERSTWADYDTDCVSEGGGVWPRTAKVIELPEPVRAALGIEATRLAPNELISAILTAPVDLLWNGGIGTYIKAAAESHAAVGDKANDGVRVDARDLRCRVIGEGGNLGVTQLGRVEFARGGGRVNTDAIDNAGGVDCSDHEVNIKILINRVVDNGDLTHKQRNQLLASMTEEVAGLVLRDNYRQTQGLTLMAARAGDQLDEHGRFMRALERAGRLDRAVEQLPDEEALGERHKAGQGLTRPELAVLMAYAKIETDEALRQSTFVQSDQIVGELLDYFPRPIRERFPDAVTAHPLRSEIIATVVTNHIINRMGATFLFRIRASTGASDEAVTRAYFAARDIFGLRALWHEVDRLDNQVDAAVQTRLLHRLGHLQERATLWLLRNLPAPLDVEETVTRIRPAVTELAAGLDDLLPEHDRAVLAAETDRLGGDGVPAELARRVVALETLYAVLDLVKVAADTGAALERAARIYFAVGTELALDWLREMLAGFPAEDPWQERYRTGLEEEFFVQLRVLTIRVLRGADDGDADPQGSVRQWVSDNDALASRLRRTLDELRSAAQVELPMLGVALQELRNLAQAGAAEGLLEARPATTAGKDRA